MPIRSTPFILLLCVLGLACKPHPGPKETTSPDVFSWARGVGHRVNPRDGLHARLLTIASDGASRPASACIAAATAFVMAPAKDPRVFFLIRGQLAVGPLGVEASPAPARWSAPGPPPMFTALLAVRSVGTDVEVLALGHTDPAEDDTYVLLRITAAGDIVGVASAVGRRELTDRAAFFAAFSGTRCRADGRECLLFSTYRDRTDIAVEPAPGAAPRELFPLDTEVLDLAYAPGEGPEIMALVPCEKV